MSSRPPRAFVFAFGLVLAACAAAPAAPPTDAATAPDSATLCASDAECDDGLHCNGDERCDPSSARGNGCVPGTPPCPATCDEDTDACTTPCPDRDGDGARDAACGGDDCDDTDPERFAGNVEVCDASAHDEDCDPSTVAGAGEGDVDADGFVSAACCNGSGGSRRCGRDCDDARGDRHPDVTDDCDGVDTDCDERVDEDPERVFYEDVDGDGWGVPGTTVRACGAPGGFAVMVGDCDDARGSVHPGLPEVCEGALDEDCDGAVDEDCPCAPVGMMVPCGTTDVGSCQRGFQTCTASGLGACVGAIEPTVEACGGDDEDCDGRTDESGAAGEMRFCLDADGDGWGVDTTCTMACTAPADYVARAGDCDDDDAGVAPMRPELCDGADQDCDRRADEGLPEIMQCPDTDGDGYGAMGDGRLRRCRPACDGTPGLSRMLGDCSDDHAGVHPGADYGSAPYCAGGRGFAPCGTGTESWDYDCDGMIMVEPIELSPPRTVCGRMMPACVACEEFYTLPESTGGGGSLTCGGMVERHHCTCPTFGGLPEVCRPGSVTTRIVGCR